MSGEHAPKAWPMCPCGLYARAHRPSHVPKLWPICTCGADAINHRVKHVHRGEGLICECGLPKQNHLVDTGYTFNYVGIDGEGMGRDPHRYILLTAADENGTSWSLENHKGIETETALYWMLEKLKKCRVFSFSFGYDISCLLKDLPNKLLYLLMRPSLRYVGSRLKPIRWRGFSIDWLQGRLSVKGKMGRVIIWDIFKFFQCSFVKALEAWGIDALNIEAMKQRRGKFQESELDSIREYCKSECVQLAKLSRKLIETHRKVGLTLHAYFGAGSTASSALVRLDVMQFKGEVPAEMTMPIACGFFGGRFEHSVMGIIPEVWGYDISSAYPYQLYKLPCLECGRWEHVSGKQVDVLVTEKTDSITTALVRYVYRGSPSDTWAPFPHRSAKGSICYPFRSTGWAWLPEILSAVRGRFGRVQCLEAWVYRTDCDHHPFKGVSELYRERVALGKDAAGIVLKLGVNGIAGKLMQSTGIKPKFQCWPWASLVTSGTRAQLLDAISSADDPSDILGLATDGVYARKRLFLEKPIDTGTSDLAKPLGGWEETHYPEGMLFVKPGIYSSLADGSVRARGIGRQALAKARPQLLETWKRGEREYTITVDRFHGCKTTINHKHRRSPNYGQWTRFPIRVKFACPNRTADMGLFSTSIASAPYRKSLLSPEKIEAIVSEAIDYEQP